MRFYPCRVIIFLEILGFLVSNSTQHKTFQGNKAGLRGPPNIVGSNWFQAIAPSSEDAPDDDDDGIYTKKTAIQNKKEIKVRETQKEDTDKVIQELKTGLGDGLIQLLGQEFSSMDGKPEKPINSDKPTLYSKKFPNFVGKNQFELLLRDDTESDTDENIESDVVENLTPTKKDDHNNVQSSQQRVEQIVHPLEERENGPRHPKSCYDHSSDLVDAGPFQQVQQKKFMVELEHISFSLKEKDLCGYWKNPTNDLKLEKRRNMDWYDCERAFFNLEKNKGAKIKKRIIDYRNNKTIFRELMEMKYSKEDRKQGQITENTCCNEEKVVKYPSKLKPGHTNLTIATFNINKLEMDQELLNYDGKQDISQQLNRYKKIARVLDDLDADIILINEVTSFGLLFFVSKLMKRPNYRIFMSKTDGDGEIVPAFLTRIRPSLCLTSLVIADDPVCKGQTKKSLSTSAPTFYNKGDKMSTRNLIASFKVHYTDTDDQQEYVQEIKLFGVHFLTTKYCSDKNEPFRKIESMSIASVVSEILDNNKQTRSEDNRILPIVLGDFNEDSSQSSDTSKETFKYQNVHKTLSLKGRMVSCFDGISSDNKVRKNYFTHDAKIIDFIYVPKSVIGEVEKAFEKLDVQVPFKDDINSFKLSDHNPVRVTIDLAQFRRQSSKCD